MSEHIIDGETGDPLTETAAPDAPEWPGRPLEVINLTDVVYHVSGADCEASITAAKRDTVDLMEVR